jgi:hypothetical protein
LNNKCVLNQQRYKKKVTQKNPNIALYIISTEENCTIDTEDNCINNWEKLEISILGYHIYLRKKEGANRRSY